MIKILLKFSLVFAVSWTVIIFILCYTPGRFIPTTNWLELLSFDKFVHGSMFFVLTCSWLLFGFKSGKLYPALIFFILLGCISYGGLLEIMQAKLFSQRSGDWMDFIANSVGCFIGLLFFNKQKTKLTL
jgi:hypothetical protein